MACSTGFSACGEEIGRGGEEEEEEEEGALPASALAAAAAAAGGGSWRDRCVDELARGLDGARFAAMLGLQALLRHTRICPCALFCISLLCISSSSPHPPRHQRPHLYTPWPSRYRRQADFVREMQCPRCGAGTIIPIVYGFPR